MWQIEGNAAGCFTVALIPVYQPAQYRTVFRYSVRIYSLIMLNWWKLPQNSPGTVFLCT